MRLRDKVIIVTGSTSGIGRAIAERAVAEGARVLVHGIMCEEGEALVAKLGAAAVGLTGVIGTAIRLDSEVIPWTARLNADSRLAWPMLKLVPAKSERTRHTFSISATATKRFASAEVVTTPKSAFPTGTATAYSK